MRRLLGLVLLVGLLGLADITPARAAGGTVYEKVTTLDEALHVAERLRAAGLEVALTRSTDRFVGLATRALAARDAHLLVSIHNNGSTSRSVVGTEAYYQIGNRAGGQLAYDIVRAVSAAAGTVVRGAFTRRGDNGDYYAVLRETRTTAVIVEGTFLSNPGEARRLASPQFRRRIADGIADAIIGRLVVPPVPQADGPPAPKGALLPTPPNLVVSAPAARSVDLAWGATAGASSYEVWRDGRLVGRTGVRRFHDSGLTPGRHRYEVRASLDLAGAVLQQSRSARAEALVPWRVLLDPGHGGGDPGAIGRW